jgi:hypothetical protein
MNSLEFTAKIEHGVIRLPKEFEEYENTVARVIVTVKPTETSQKEKLSALFAEMRGVKMFENIENPTEWQKKLRDEWD